MTTTSYAGPKAPVILRLEKMGAFSDYLLLRDAKALSPRPALTPCLHAGHPRLEVRDDFVVRCDHVISADQGQEFLEITRDPNDIHAKQSILPGAMTVAKMLLPVEVLAPALRIESLRVKFRAAAFYGERMANTMRWEYLDHSAVRIEVTAYQRQQVVATAYMFAQVLPEDAAIEEVKERKTNQEEVTRVCAFLETLGVRPEAYFDKDGVTDYTYPFAFMASLPPGEIVRQFEGLGGIINMLTLDLGDKAKMPIVGRGGPEVRLKPGRIRQAFRQIIAHIIDGITTYYRGAALVYPTASLL